MNSYAGRWPGSRKKRDALRGRAATFLSLRFSSGYGRESHVSSTMRSRVTLGLSLTANLILAMGWLWSVNSYSRRMHRADLAPAEPATPVIKTNVLVRRQFFTWREVESDDYASYIENLRDIACPEQTIRDIIIADVNALYARKRATEIITPEQQWWRSLPDEEIVKVAVARANEIDLERRSLLTQLLGTNWESGDLISLPRPSRQGVTLDGPVLGVLPTEVKLSVQEINLRSQDRLAAYLEAQREAGKTADPATLASLQQQLRAELAQVLTPPQFEEYLLRFSDSANALRKELGELKFFNATPDEFRAMFRAADALNLQLQALAGATDPLSVNARRALEEQRLTAIKNALGPERYAQYILLQDSRYQTAYATAVQAGTPEAASALYEINRAAQEEQARLRAQPGLSAEQLAILLKRTELEALKGTAQALGQELPPEPEPPPKPEPKKIHVLQPGEGLNSVARIYGVEPAALRAANPNVDFTKLKGGESVSIPIKLLPVFPVPAP